MDTAPVRTNPALRRGLARIAAGKLAALAAALLLPILPVVAADDEVPATPTDKSKVFEQVDSMLTDLREIMGFGPRRPVKFTTMSKARFRALYHKRMKAEQDPREIRGEVLFLQLFGLVPDDFDYEKTVLDLLSEQAWALYDFKRKTLYLSDWAPPDAREFALLHELVHAIDDQNFNLMRYVEGACSPPMRNQGLKLASRWKS